jgi:thioredoxin 1
MYRQMGMTMILASLTLTACNSSRVTETPTGSDSSGATGPTVEVNDGNFEQVVLQSDKPVLVDFWATWCGPCQMIAPIVGELAAEYEGRAVVAKLDVDVAGQTAAQYHVEEIPMLIVFHQGREVSRTVGVTSKEELARKLDAALQ